MKKSVVFFMFLAVSITFLTCTKDDSSDSQPTDIELSSYSIDENEPPNTAIGEFTTTDPGLGTHTYTLVIGEGDDDNASFTIAGNQLRSNVSFDFETQSTYLIRIRTTNEAGNYFEKAFVININDLDEIENIAGNYFLEFDYTFSGSGVSGSSYGSISSVTITQSGNNIQVRGNPGTIDEENNVSFSGDFIDDGTQHFNGDYNPSTGVISGNLSGNIMIDVWNGLYFQSVSVNIISGTCTLSPL